MKSIKQILLFAFMALFGTAYAADPFADSDEPHGIVDLDIAKPAKQLFEGYFLEVDGENVIPSRKQLLLKPGKHQIKIGAIISELAPGLTHSPRGVEPDNVVEIDVKEGMRYSVAAKVDGKYRGNWEAVVSMTNSIK